MMSRARDRVVKHDREQALKDRRDEKAARRQERREARRDRHLGQASMTDPTALPMLGAIDRIVGAIR